MNIVEQAEYIAERVIDRLEVETNINELADAIEIALFELKEQSK